MFRDSLIRTLIVLPFALALGTAYAADCANGKALFTKKTAGTPISCSQSSCHGNGSDNVISGNKIANGANNPSLIDSKLDTQADMAGLRSLLSLTANDIDDLAYYIAVGPNCPAPTATLAVTSSLSFTPGVTVGGTGPFPVTVTNTGGATANSVVITVSTNPTEFSIGANTCPASLAAGASCSVTINFKPTAVGARTGILNLARTGATSNGWLMSGTGTTGTPPPPPPPPTQGQLSLPGSAIFVDQLVGTTSAAKQLSLSNTGGAAVAVSSISSNNPSEFTITSSTCVNVAAGGSCAFNLTFKPGVAGARSAGITITSNGVGSPQTIMASGTGTSTPPPPPPPATTVQLIEYYHAGFGHYFVTTIPLEISNLDTGKTSGWARTTKQIKVYAGNSTGLSTMRRFFNESFSPKSSHFYTSKDAEYADVLAKFKDWGFEGDVFYVRAAAIDGSCPSGHIPVYRLYNQGMTGAPNHRYTTDLAVRDAMVAAGHAPEGEGTIGVGFCAPQ